MDKTTLVREVANLFRINGHEVQISVEINHREIDVVAKELHGLVRKIILIECAEHRQPVGVDKVQEDVRKLRAAKETMKDQAVVMVVSSSGFTKEASGYARENGIEIQTPDGLKSRLINFDPLVRAAKNDGIRPTIEKEYQPTKLHPDGHPEEARPAMDFLKSWLTGGQRWLTILGDYGVGKSWTLKRFWYVLMHRYEEDPTGSPLPVFIPLQRFVKAFDFENLILGTFQLYGVTGIHYPSFERLMSDGRIVFLFDSFDEMAQALSRDVIRDNLSELLRGVARNSKAVMTSRPTYFESRYERFLVTERDGETLWHPQDRSQIERQSVLARKLSAELESSAFARLNDLTIEQRRRLFAIVLENKPAALNKMLELDQRFRGLENMSQRAVIARLLISVAETLATNAPVTTPDGFPLLPEDLVSLNQAKIFEIVVNNLLQRDANIGGLSAGDRLSFLRRFAAYLQRPRRAGFFAAPEEIRSVVRELFSDKLRVSDHPEQLLENLYRTCRRHSGLTTESQFLDTSGRIDSPVDEYDTDSRVGFSHNSLREYLVADAISDGLRRGIRYEDLRASSVTEAVGHFVVGIADNYPDFLHQLSAAYQKCADSSWSELLFRVIYWFLQKDASRFGALIGCPGSINSIDLSNLDFSRIRLQRCHIVNCVAADTDFRGADLTEAVFEKTIIDGCMFDGAQLRSADFRAAELLSIFVYDEFDRQTTAALTRKDARQWLFSRGALVTPEEDLNPLLGKPWYEAAREVMKTLEHRISGTHQDQGLSKGVKAPLRQFAADFVQFLVKASVLEKIVRSDSVDGWVVRVAKDHRKTVSQFTATGSIAGVLRPFFDKHLKDLR